MAPQMGVDNSSFLLLQPPECSIRHLSMLCMRNWPLRLMESYGTWMKLCYNRLNSCYLSDTDSAVCLATTYTIAWRRHSLLGVPHPSLSRIKSYISSRGRKKNRVPTYWGTVI